MVSSKKARDTMLSCVDLPINEPIIDIGSGWGTLVVAVAKKHPTQRVIGYELSWLPWCFSLLRKKCLGLTNLTLYRANAFDADINSAGVLFCYLFPEAMEKLYHKLVMECSHQIIVVSNNFALPHIQAHSTVTLNDFYRTPVYTYYYEKKANG